MKGTAVMKEWRLDWAGPGGKEKQQKDEGIRVKGVLVGIQYIQGRNKKEFDKGN